MTRLLLPACTAAMIFQVEGFAFELNNRAAHKVSSLNLKTH
jgi:hypothetical protein